MKPSGVLVFLGICATIIFAATQYPEFFGKACGFYLLMLFLVGGGWAGLFGRRRE